MTLHRLGCFTEVWEGWTPPPDTRCRNPDSPREAWSGSHRLASLTPPTSPDPKSRAGKKSTKHQKHGSTVEADMSSRLVLTWQQTHHFRGDVGIREVSVLTHNRQVTVHFYGQGVSSQDHDPAEGGQVSKCHHGGTLPARSKDLYIVTMKEVLEQLLTLSLLCWWISELL